MRIIIPLERAYYRQRRARHLIAISRVFEREIQTEYGWRRPSSVIYHGTDSQLFRPPTDDAERQALRRRFQVPDSAWCWLFMGEAIKGLRQAIAALPAFPNARLLVVSRSEFAAFRQQAETIGVADRVIFHGFDPRPQEAFRAADVFVYASGYDPFGMVATEAMSTGIPVVLGQEIGAAELIEPGRNGYLCDPTQDASLRLALQQIQADPAAASDLGLRGRATVQGVGWDHCASETLAVYERVAADIRATGT
jgi:UDP-glucose:(heptosyl)LPS alpha-1,3-glucosyltransferase